MRPQNCGRPLPPAAFKWRCKSPSCRSPSRERSFQPGQPNARRAMSWAEGGNICRYDLTGHNRDHRIQSVPRCVESRQDQDVRAGQQGEPVLAIIGDHLGGNPICREHGSFDSRAQRLESDDTPQCGHTPPRPEIQNWRTLSKREARRDPADNNTVARGYTRWRRRWRRRSTCRPLLLATGQQQGQRDCQCATRGS
jgi:hypothetical protein